MNKLNLYGQTEKGVTHMNKKPVIAVFYGWTFILGITLLASIVLALILKFTDLNEPTLSTLTLIIGLLTLFMGGVIAGIKGKTRGWLVGSIVGIGFSLLIFFIQYLGYQHTFTLSQSFHHLGFFIAALIGGIIGVNFFSQKN